MRGRFQNPHEARDALGSIGDGAAEFIRASIHATAEGIVLLCHIVPLMASVVYDATRKERARAAKRFARRRQSPPPPRISIWSVVMIAACARLFVRWGPLAHRLIMKQNLHAFKRWRSLCSSVRRSFQRLSVSWRPDASHPMGSRDAARASHRLCPMPLMQTCHSKMVVAGNYRLQ